MVIYFNNSAVRRKGNNRSIPSVVNIRANSNHAFGFVTTVWSLLTTKYCIYELNSPIFDHLSH